MDTLNEIQKLGYRITIKLEGTTKYVTFDHNHAFESYTLPMSWADSFPDQQIKLECVSKLINWAGLRYKKQ